MVKWLRNTLYDGDEPVATMVFREPEEGGRDNIYAMATRMRMSSAASGLDTDIEVFEFEDDFIRASWEAKRRSERRIPKRQRNIDILHDWAMGLLPIVRDGGVLAANSPVPLSDAEILEVFEKISATPEYRGQRLIAVSKEGETVVFERR